MHAGTVGPRPLAQAATSNPLEGSGRPSRAGAKLYGSALPATDRPRRTGTASIAQVGRNLPRSHEVAILGFAQWITPLRHGVVCTSTRTAALADHHFLAGRKKGVNLESRRGAERPFGPGQT
jgi:hypothetical protein